MRLPPLFRTTPFRLTLLFLALYAAAASAFLAYAYAITAGQISRLADTGIAREIGALETVYRHGGRPELIQTIQAHAAENGDVFYVLTDPTGRRIWGDVALPSVTQFDENNTTWMRLNITARRPGGGLGKRLIRGERQKLTGGETLFVGIDVSQAEAFVLLIVRGLWGAGVIILILGLGGGLLVSRNVNRSLARLNTVVSAVRGGDLRARVALRESGDEYDDLAAGLNDMLDRLERSIGGLRHAGDAIAHDLRSPLTRLRTRLEVALLDVEAGRGDATAALAQALDDADGLLRTFSTVLAIARLQSTGAPEQTPFDATALTKDVIELYQPLAEEKGLEFTAELAGGLVLKGNREFLAQALANVLDNAIKYNCQGGAVMLRLRRRASGEVEISVTDTGPGVSEADRERVVQRFVRLENSRSQPGAGLGLSLVSAVVEAHGGRLEIDEGPGRMGDIGPGLRVALVLPRAG